MSVIQTHHPFDPAKFKDKPLADEEKYSLLKSKWVKQNHCPKTKFGEKHLRYIVKWEENIIGLDILFQKIPPVVLIV